MSIIIMLFLIFNIQIKGHNIKSEESVDFIKTVNYSEDSFSKKELVNFYKKKGYKLIYTKNHKSKLTNNCFFIFEHEIGKTNFKQDRILVVTKSLFNNKYTLLYKLENFIYNKDSTMTCYYGTNKEAFNKIATTGLYITVEQNSCTKRRGETVHEYFTFKFDLVSKEYLLDKYSIIIEETTIGDEFPVQTLAEKDFGIIKLKDYYNGILDKYKVKFPEHIYEIIK